MLMEKNSTSGFASAVLRPVNVAAPAILPTSSLYPTPRRSYEEIEERIGQTRVRQKLRSRRHSLQYETT